MEKVLRKFTCHYCQSDQANKSALYSHIRRHGAIIPPMEPSEKFQQGIRFHQYVSAAAVAKKPDIEYSIMFACAVCNHVDRTLQDLALHFQSHLLFHSEIKVSSTPPPQQPQQPVANTSGTTTVSPPSTSSHGRKRPRNDIHVNKNNDNNSNSRRRVFIAHYGTQQQQQQPGGDDTITLFTKGLAFQEDDTPRLAPGDIERLEKTHIIRLQSCSSNQQNITMDPTSRSVIAQHKRGARQLASLTAKYPNALSKLRLALSSNRTHEHLYDYTFPRLDDDNNATTTVTNEEQRFYRVIKHILVDFASKCHRASTTSQLYLDQRTFYVDRVVSIFSYYEDHCDKLHFEWFEKIIKNLQAVEISSVSIETQQQQQQSAPASASATTASGNGSDPGYAQGLAYSTLVGFADDERVVFKLSSPTLSLHDDTLKLIKALTAMVVSKAYDLYNARFHTFTKYKAIGIQVIKRKLTLLVLYMDSKSKKFVLEERRSAAIPLNYHEKSHWFHVFELLAHFHELVEEQDLVDGLLRQQHCGGDGSIVESDTIQSSFEAAKYDIHIHRQVPIVIQNTTGTTTSAATVPVSNNNNNNNAVPPTSNGAASTSTSSSQGNINTNPSVPPLSFRFYTPK